MVVFVLSLAGCSTARPILYPNAHLQSVGEGAADRDIGECERKAKAAGADRQMGRAVGAAIGAASGAVVVDRCLREKGYEPTGWQ